MRVPFWAELDPSVSFAPCFLRFLLELLPWASWVRLLHSLVFAQPGRKHLSLKLSTSSLLLGCLSLWHSRISWYRKMKFLSAFTNHLAPWYASDLSIEAVLRLPFFPISKGFLSKIGLMCQQPLYSLCLLKVFHSGWSFGCLAIA